jgi:GntR family transcriptional repressor for pyruvate dehydrogenase complex
VACPTADILADSLSVFVRLNESGLFDLLEARLALEVEIADLAAQRATPEDCQELEDQIHELEAVINDPEKYVEADIRLHAAFARAARNEILMLLLDSIRGAMRENVRVLLLRRQKAVGEAMDYHREIVEGIKQHSPEKARLAMRAHLESVRLRLNEVDVEEKVQKDGE